MNGATEQWVKLGYTQQQAEVIDKLDDLFEKAIEVKLCSGDQATAIGVTVGKIFGRFAGIIKE